LASCWDVANTANFNPNMAHPTDPELLNHILQLISEQGTDGLAEGIRLQVHQSVRLGRAHALQVHPCQRTDTRKGHANGFKDKTLTTRLGPSPSTSRKSAATWTSLISLTT